MDTPSQLYENRSAFDGLSSACRIYKPCTAPSPIPVPPKLRILVRHRERVIRLSSTCHIMPYLEVAPLEA